MTREDDLINEKIEGYHVAAELISNSFRSIFLGESISSTDPHQLVVIELFYSAAAHTQQEQQDILDKISVLQQVDHSHILPILAAGFHKDVPYIITEYLPVGSLYERFQQGVGQPIQMKEAILTLAQVGQALYYAHQRQVIHGSLRPQNVLFTTQNEVLVMGFHHHALLLPDEAEESAKQEFSIYRAPEQLPGQASEKGDQYALGCLAYALFTGSQAFTVPSVNTPGTYYKTKSLISPGRMNSGLPLYIENAILKAMSREPDQRYPDIAAFLAALGIPSAGRKSELKETVALLAQIMQEGSPEGSLAPELEIDTLDTVKMLEVAATRDGKRTNSNTFSLLPSDRDGQVPFNAALPLVSDADTHEKAHPAARFQLAYGGKSVSSFRNIRKNFTTRPRRTSAVLLGLIAFMIICVTILVDLNFSTPSKKVTTLPSIHTTSATHSSTQTGVIIPIPTIPHSSTPASTIGTTIPPRKATPQPTALPTTAPTATPTATPAPLMIVLDGFFNNEGIGNAPGQANFDGHGYSYPANQLPSGGQINVQGIPYQFPATGSGTNDNIVAFGQTISLRPGNYRQAFLLAAASWGPVSGTVVIKYIDGSTSRQSLTVLDWYTSSGALNETYRYTSNGINNHPVCIYAIPISLDSTRVADALVLPYRQSGPFQNSRMHIFALTLLS
ncbi:MAG TPA: serine/threonine-protein kinase [Ktedonobacteraceae bacterium]